MDTGFSQQIERDVYLAQAGRDELAERIARWARQDGSVEPLPGLYLIRRNAPTGPIPGVLNPAFCVIAQGRKDIFLGATRYQYDPAHFNREYKRLFGAPPMRDVERLRTAAVQSRPLAAD